MYVYVPPTPTQHQYMLVEHKPSDKVIMKDSSKVIYSEVDKDKLKPVVPPPGTSFKLNWDSDNLYNQQTFWQRCQ